MSVIGSYRIALETAPRRRRMPFAVRSLIFTLLLALLAFALWWVGAYLDQLTRWDASYHTQVESAVAGLLGLGYLGIPLLMVIRRRPGSYWWCWGAIFLLTALGSAAAIAGVLLAALFLGGLPAVREHYGKEPLRAFTIRLRHILFS